VTSAAEILGAAATPLAPVAMLVTHSAIGALLAPIGWAIIGLMATRRAR